MGICISTAQACISVTDDVVNSFIDGQSRYNNESKLAKEHLGQQNKTSGKGNSTHISNVLKSGLSPIYPSLPKAATKYHCRNVYDGDTLTLDDGMRVRFLGIDTPEMKENQAFSLEAKEYTKKYCHGKDVWLTFEESGGKGNELNKDHYGRILAFVWVPLDNNNKSNPSQWLCINEGLIASGLAHAYSPSKTKKVHNHDKLLGLQRLARVHKCGQWKSFKDYNVTISPNGSAFHKCKNKKSTTNDCKHLARSKSLSVIQASDAYDKGMHPCRNCLG
jgi:endonuclease YncB( thermonuclease family)